MPKKLSFEYVKGYISDKGDELLSKEYINIYAKLEVKCHVCNKIYEQLFTRIKQ